MIKKVPTKEEIEEKFSIDANYEKFIDLELFKRQLLNSYEDYLEYLREGQQ